MTHFSSQYPFLSINFKAYDDVYTYLDLLWLRDLDLEWLCLGPWSPSWLLLWLYSPRPVLLSDPPSSKLIFMMAGTPNKEAGLALPPIPGDTGKHRHIMRTWQHQHYMVCCMKIHTFIVQHLNPSCKQRRNRTCQSPSPSGGCKEPTRSGLREEFLPH